MITKKADILVLGAGIIGTSLAQALQAAGRQVLIIDKGGPGSGCSYGNAGWLTPCFSMPLPQPGMFFKSLTWLMNPESPLYIKPDPSPLLMRWLLHFMKCMNHQKMNQSIEVLTEISKESLEFYAKMAASQNNFGFDKQGLLMVSATEEGLRAAVQEMELMAHQGIEGRKLSPDEVFQLEPSLKKILRGGVYFPREAHAEPLSTVQRIYQDFLNLGGAFQQGEVYDFEFAGSKIKKVLTTQGNFEADIVVLAMGTWSQTLAHKLRSNVPILGGKGYSLIVDNFKVKPVHPIMIVERKIAVTPRAQSVRVARTLELVNQDYSITKRRVEAILRGAQEFFDFPEEPRISELWRGLRPCTPDGVPMIGFSKRWSNLFYSAGHQMLGLQSAPGSAKLAKQLILNEAPYVDPRPFLPDRF